MQLGQDEIIIDLPNFPPIKIARSKVQSIRIMETPPEVCNVIASISRREGIILAGSSIDGKVSFYNISPGGQCYEIILKDGRRLYVSA